MAWKAAGNASMAFVMLNRYLDLADALEDPDANLGQLENADFVNTDVPFDISLPEQPYGTEAAREEVTATSATIATILLKLINQQKL